MNISLKNDDMLPSPNYQPVGKSAFTLIELLVVIAIIAILMAVLYMKQTRHEEAEQLLLDAFNGRTTKLGPEHPHTLDSLRNLIQLYEAWNKSEKAKEWRAKLPLTEAVRE